MEIIKEPQVERIQLDNDSDRNTPSLQQESPQAQPEALGRWTGKRIFVLLVDVLFALVPLFFIALAVIALRLHNQPTSAIGEAFQRILPLLPTIFPIVFAALMGKYFKSQALYLMEKGGKLGTIERFQGCLTLFGAMEMQIKLRRLDVLGVLIVAVWALSPLGGQSGLRLISRETKIAQFSQPIRYMPYEASSTNRFESASSMASDRWGTISPLYASAIISARSNYLSNVDNWGNIKIPSYNALADSISPATPDAWYPVKNSSDLIYSSLIGIPVAGLPQQGVARFNITSQQWNVTCFNSEFLGNETMDLSMLQLYNLTVTTPLGENGDVAQGPLGKKPVEFTMLSSGGTIGEGLTKINCGVNIQYVDSQIVCNEGDCSVSSMRLNPGLINEVLAPGGLPLTLVMNTTLYAMSLTFRGSTAEFNIPSPFESFLENPSTGMTRTTLPTLSSVAMNDLGNRLAMAINSLWLSSYGFLYLTGGLSSDLRTYDYNPNIFNNGNSAQEQASWGNATAVGTRNDGYQYVCNRGFAIAFAIISLILFIAAAGNLFLSAWTIAPNILGFVSSQLRGSMHADFNSSNLSHLDGLELTRLLYDKRIKMADTSGMENIGHVALVAGDEGGATRLRK